MHVHERGIKQIKKREKMMDKVVLTKLKALERKLTEQIDRLEVENEGEAYEQSQKRMIEQLCAMNIRSDLRMIISDLELALALAPNSDQMSLDLE